MARILNVKDAINEAIAQEMWRDSSIYIMGEDIAGGAGNPRYENKSGLGGAYGVTAGLVEQFGRIRVVDTPISETAFLGMGLGAAFAGLRPIIEIMYADFIGVCYDQLLNQIAKFHFMYGGKKPVPLVLRMPCGTGFRAGPEHSQTLYPLFASIPGLKVVTPSNAYDAKGLMIRAIRDNDPVVFLEYKRLYLQECDVPEESYEIPFGKAEVKRAGTDVTIVGVHKMVNEALAAAEKLAEAGISAEVIDPRTISPLDANAIIESVNKTGHLVIADESYPRFSLASDIAAIVCERAFGSLKAPIARVLPPHAHIPFSAELEDAWTPDSQKIIAAVQNILG